MMGDVTERMRAGRDAIEKSLDDMQEQVESGRLPVAVIVTVAAVAVVALAVGLGVKMYSRRRRRTLAERLQGALPDSVRDLPGGIRVRLKKAL